jgi:hypothetical protein
MSSAAHKLAVVHAHTPAQAQALPPALDTSSLSSFSTLDSSIRQAVDRARNHFVEVGYYGYRLILHVAGEWTRYGFDSEDHYRSSLGIPPYMWRDYTTLAAKLSHLALEDIQELTIGAARCLARVRSDLWGEFAWLEEAKLLSAKEFENVVKQRHNAHPAKGGKLLKEARQEIRMAVPASQRGALEGRLEALRGECALKSAGEALALALGAAEKLARLSKTSPAAQAAFDRAIEEAKRACS